MVSCECVARGREVLLSLKTSEFGAKRPAWAGETSVCLDGHKSCHGQRAAPESVAGGGPHETTSSSTEKKEDLGFRVPRKF